MKKANFYMFLVLIVLFLSNSIGYSADKKHVEKNPKAGKSISNPVIGKNLEERVLSQTQEAKEDVVKNAIKEAKKTARPKLLISISLVETKGSFKNKVGKRGELGYCQVNPKVWGKLLRKEGIIGCNNDLKLPSRTYKAAEKVIAFLEEENNGNLKRALAEYNGGSRPGKAAYRYADRVISLSKRI
jgi:soluble lytic murein transglycosylase-like protein